MFELLKKAASAAFFMPFKKEIFIFVFKLKYSYICEPILEGLFRGCSAIADVAQLVRAADL